MAKESATEKRVRESREREENRAATETARRVVQKANEDKEKRDEEEAAQAKADRKAAKQRAKADAQALEEREKKDDSDYDPENDRIKAAGAGDKRSLAGGPAIRTAGSSAPSSALIQKANSGFIMGVVPHRVKKQKVTGGSVALKDLAIAVRHIGIMLRGNCMTYDHKVSNSFYLGVMVFLVSGASKKVSDLRDDVDEMVKDENLAFSFIREHVRGQTGITAWISTALKTFWKDENVIFFGKKFAHATEEVQEIFAHKEETPFWPTLPEDRKLNKALKEFQRSFYCDQDWMVSFALVDLLLNPSNALQFFHAVL